MTWQRIDDDTYIDDSLVTCAEYQLFIDEMREQGKYYQPDHWTLYQFPEGQAREPILGVRHSDAVAFCRWLSKRDDGEWKYHLPTRNEAYTFPMKFNENNSLGYWIDQYWVTEHNNFTWAGQVPKDARKIQISLRNLALDIPLAFDRALDLDRTRAVDIPLVEERAHAFDRVCNRALDFDRAIELDQTLGGVHDFIRVFEHNLAFDGVLAKMLNLYADFFTLRERIAGRSPAFEGIRLVKERIK